ncbi:MAG: hypothetical protein KJ725_00015 [Gammaproteobacteria bacterium]|nr:hypothetical protein [Gammaproteobacteria bacterium]
MAWDTFCDVDSARDALNQQRAWLITFTEADVSVGNDARNQPASSTPRMPSDWPPSWGLMQMSATALTVIKQPSPPAQPIPLAVRLALQALL